MAAPNTEPMKLPVLSLLMLSALGVSVLSAAAVFLFLLMGEQHAPNPESNASAVSSTPRKATTPAAITKSPQRDDAVARTSGVSPADFEQTDFSVFKSRSYRAVGPVRIRVLRTKKNGTCDIAVLVNNKRTKRLGAAVGASIAIVMPGSLPHAALVVKGIATNRVWGYVLVPKSTAKSRHHS